MQAATRLLWKEYRLQRGFLLSMLAIFLLVLLSAYLYLTLQGEPLPVPLCFGVGAVVTVLYVLGCSATLFATEHEMGTYAFQRALPFSAGSLVVGKFGYAVASTLFMATFVILTAAMISGGRMSLDGVPTARVVAPAVAVLEVGAWGIFFSLVLHQPLRAAILAIVAQSLGVHLVVASFYPSPVVSLGLSHYELLLLPRTVFALLLLGGDALLALRWLNETPYPLPLWLRSREAAPTVVRTKVRASARQRLLWQGVRQSRRLMVVLLLCFAVNILLLVLSNRRLPDRSGIGDPLLLIGMLAYLAPFLGASVFAADNRRQSFRFLAERGVSPSSIWWSRQAVWGGAFLLLAVCSLGIATASNLSVQLDRSVWRTMGALAGLAVLNYSVGQLVSITVRSGVLAYTLAGAAAGAASAWAVFVVSFGVSPWLAVAPLPFIFFVVSWLHARDWLLERQSIRDRFRLVAQVLAPLAGVALAVIVYRWQELPATPPPSELTRFLENTDNQDRFAVTTYRTAASDLREAAAITAPEAEWSLDDPLASAPFAQIDAEDRHWPAVATWVEGSQKQVSVLVRAAEVTQPFSAPLGPRDDTVNNVQTSGSFLFWSGVDLELQGKLSEAWERYMAVMRLSAQLRDRGGFSQQRAADALERLVYRRLPVWAIHSSQTVDGIRQRQQQLRTLEAAIPSRADQIAAHYALDYARLKWPDGVRKSIAEVASGSQAQILNWMARLFPWEIERCRRVLNEEGRRQQVIWDEYAALTGQRKTLAVWLPKVTAARSYGWVNTPMASFFVTWTPWAAADAVHSETYRQRMRTAAHLALAVQMWQIEHGEMPPDLNALVGEWIPEVPHDLLAGGPFVLHAEGESEVSASFESWQGTELVLEAGQPYISIAEPQTRPRERTRATVDGMTTEVLAIADDALPIPLRDADR